MNKDNSNGNTTDCSGNYERCIFFRNMPRITRHPRRKARAGTLRPQGRSRHSRPTVMESKPPSWIRRSSQDRREVVSSVSSPAGEGGRSRRVSYELVAGRYEAAV